MRLAAITALLAACAGARDAEDPTAWYSSGAAYDVAETVLFTEEPYDFTGETPVDGLPRAAAFQTLFADADGLPDGACDDWSTTSTLPAEITGVATMHPRYYFKTSGCRPVDDADIDSDEKYYGSFFIEDASGGMFVLGDSKVAHFEMGDKVTLNVRAMKEFFGLNMVFSQDLITVERGPFPIAFQEVEGELGSADAAKVRRKTGTVGYAGDFGEVQLCSGEVGANDLDNVNEGVRDADFQLRCIAEGRGFYVIIDSELQRRGVEPAVGEVLQITGPVLFSFDQYRIVVTRLGQIEAIVD
jgi:hypothetical protein